MERHHCRGRPMTLLQVLFSRERIIQVSDRRLTFPDGTIADDSYTKLVCWNGAFAVGFTGIARVDRRGKESTAEWIAKVLADHSAFEYGVEALRQEANDRIGRLSWPDKRLAVVIAGFDYRADPLVAEVANFDTTTGVSPDPNTFHTRFASIDTGRLTAAHTVGAPLGDVENRLLGRYIPRVLRRDKVNGHNRAIKLLVESQRRVHRRDGTVGPDAQVVMIPRRDVAPGVVMSNLDGTDIPSNSSSFLYFEEQGFRHRQHGPLMASGGGVIDQVVGEADPENPDNQSMSIRFVKVPSGWN